VTFFLSMLLTAVMRRLAWRFDILDHPGERKVHAEPMPLMGGVAIVVSFFCVRH
jgi:UDP-GlcNAc:undecaprenyl-phosphate GlcNAc-1-phosphate transferase